MRAVDTATHPDHQRQGLFRELTLHALDELTADDVRFVFNTPNDESRPGYLKMGWHMIGRPALRVRPRGIGSLIRIARARGAAAKWSEAAGFGSSPQDAFADDEDVEDALNAFPTDRLTTHRSPAYLRWRFGFEPLRYRVVRRGERLGDGFAVVRLRRRGAAIEGAVCELHVPSGERAAAKELLVQIEGADYLLLAGARSLRGTSALPAPGQGPIVTWRAITSSERPSLARWHLTLGDLELL